MATCSLSVSISVKRRWYFWPCFLVAKLLVAMGADYHRVSEWIVDNCMIIECGDVEVV